MKDNGIFADLRVLKEGRGVLMWMMRGKMVKLWRRGGWVDNCTVALTHLMKMGKVDDGGWAGECHCNENGRVL